MLPSNRGQSDRLNRCPALFFRDCKIVSQSHVKGPVSRDGHHGIKIHPCRSEPRGAGLSQVVKSAAFDFGTDYSLFEGSLHGTLVEVGEDAILAQTQAFLISM